MFRFALSDSGNTLTTEMTEEGTTRKLLPCFHAVVTESEVTDSEASVVIRVISASVTRYFRYILSTPST